MAVLVESERSRVRGGATMREWMHGDHGPLCALMKAHVHVGDDQELSYGDDDHESMHVEGSYELHYGDGDHSKM